MARVEWQQKKCVKYYEVKLNTLCKKGAEMIASSARTILISGGHKKTGNLIKGIEVLKSKFKDGGYIAISTAPHTFLAEFGTIRPRKPTKHEYMKIEIDGRIIFAKVVVPMPEIPFMRPAAQRNKARIYRMFKEAVEL